MSGRGCLDCGVCPSCIERSMAYAEEAEAMSGWTTLGQLPPGTLFEMEGGRGGVLTRGHMIYGGVHAPERLRVVWLESGASGEALASDRVRVLPAPSATPSASPSLMLGFLTALAEDPSDTASLMAFRDWLCDQNRELDALAFAQGWKGELERLIREYGHLVYYLGQHDGRGAQSPQGPAESYRECIARIRQLIGLDGDDTPAALDVSNAESAPFTPITPAPPGNYVLHSTAPPPVHHVNLDSGPELVRDWSFSASPGLVDLADHIDYPRGRLFAILSRAIAPGFRYAVRLDLAEVPREPWEPSHFRRARLRLRITPLDGGPVNLSEGETA